MNSESTISTRALKQYENIYLCPISMEVMKQPYVLPCQHTFELVEIRNYLEQKKECPLCRKIYKFEDGAINLMAKQGIQIYKKQLQRKQLKNQKLKVLPIDKPKRTFQIFFREPNYGKIRTLNVEGNQSIEQIKLKMAQKDSINIVICTNLVLRFNGTFLKNQRRLSDYNIQQQSTIQSRYQLARCHCLNVNHTPNYSEHCCEDYHKSS